MSRRCRAAPTSDFAGAADHQYGLAASRMRRADRGVRPDWAGARVDIKIRGQTAVCEWADTTDHQVGDRGKIDLFDRIQVACVAYVVAGNPTLRFEAARKDRVRGVCPGAAQANPAQGNGHWLCA